MFLLLSPESRRTKQNTVKVEKQKGMTYRQEIDHIECREQGTCSVTQRQHKSRVFHGVATVRVLPE